MHFQNENASFDFLKELLIQLVSFHDFGKINPDFQRIKMNNRIGDPYIGLIKSKHSFFSSIIYLDYFLHKLSIDNQLGYDDKYILERIIIEHAYIIARHHSDLESFSQFKDCLVSAQTKSLINNLLTNSLSGYKGLKYIDVEKIKLLTKHFYYIQLELFF